MNRLQVFSCATDTASDPICLDMLGAIDSLHPVQGINGPLSAEWNFNVEPNFDHRAVQLGRWVKMYAGGSLVWSGRLEEPGRGTPWAMTATGIAAEALNYQAIAPTTGNALNLDEVVDAAIVRGLRWTRSGTLPSLPADASSASGASSVNDSLTTVGSGVGEQWFVTAAGVLTMAAPPASPGLFLVATDTAGGRSTDSYVTTYVVTYLDETTRAATTLVVTNAAAEAKVARIEDNLDLTESGYISATTATSQANAALALVAPTTNYTGTFTAAQGQLITAGGTAIDLAVADCSQLIQVIQVDPEITNDIDLTTPTTFMLSELDPDIDGQVVAITPYNTTDGS